MMRTVSLGLAEELKRRGLQWKPKPGDYYENAWGARTIVIGPIEEPPEDWVWLPTLSDLLEWLEGRGYYYLIGYSPSFKKFGIELFKDKKLVYGDDALTSEDAAAKAVLWVLEQEGNK